VVAFQGTCALTAIANLPAQTGTPTSMNDPWYRFMAEKYLLSTSHVRLTCDITLCIDF